MSIVIYALALLGAVSLLFITALVAGYLCVTFDDRKRTIALEASTRSANQGLSKCVGILQREVITLQELDKVRGKAIGRLRHRLRALEEKKI